MTIRTHVPHGAPTWMDLWTSDVEASRRFYPAVLGWEALPAAPEFGGYFQFAHADAPVAGAMGDMADAAADDTWKPYFQTDDVGAAAAAVVANGGTAHFEPMAVADLGTQFVFTDPFGAVAGAWQPGTFGGFTEVGVDGTPSWFELHTPDHAGSLAFYRAVFGWDYDTVSHTDELRYTLVRDADGGAEAGGVAGIMDDRHDPASGDAPFWRIYVERDDVDGAVATALDQGGRVVHPAEDTPYGRLAVLADAAGARFGLRASPS